MMHPRRHTNGFTLTEVLVATALSAVVLGTIFVLFVAASSTSQQGYQRIEGYEMARQVFALMERDLQAAYTSREFGENFQFAGLPQGFTFVGLTGANINQNAADPNFARITYVIYYGDPENAAPNGRSTDLRLPGSGTITLVERDMPPRPGEEAVVDFNDPANPNDDVVVRPAFAVETAENLDTVVTYSMLRYVEPGVSDLDAYPSVFDPTQGRTVDLWTWYENNRAVPDPGNPANLILAERPEDAIGFDFRLRTPDGRLLVPSFADPATLADATLVPEEADIVRNARRRELYLRMIAGDPLLPDLWSALRVTDTFNNRPTPRTPGDFVIADNIYLPAKNFGEWRDNLNVFWNGSTLTIPVDDPAETDPPRFNVVLPLSGQRYNGNYNNPNIDTAFLPGERTIRDLDGDIVGRSRTLTERKDRSNFAYSIAQRGWALPEGQRPPDATETLRYWGSTYWSTVYNIKDNLGQANGIVSPLEIGGDPAVFLDVNPALLPPNIQGADWTFRHVPVNTVNFSATASGWPADNNGDGWPDVPGAAFSTGTPLNPRLPEQIDVQLDIIVESPFPGVTEFVRRFEQTITVPAGYSRKSNPDAVVGELS